MTDKERFFDKIALDIPLSGCWMWQAQIDRDGYGRFQYKGKAQSASRVAYQLFVGEIPLGLLVLHTCDVRACVKPKHLYLGTQADNVRDMIKRGRKLQGEDHGRAKLTESQVLAIRADNYSPVSFLAAQYDVSCQNIYFIKKNISWKHI